MSHERIKHLQGLVNAQQEARKQWQEHDDAESVARMIEEEAGELVDSIVNYDVEDKGPYEVVSEIGDILYLTLRFCSEIGIDPADALELKLLRNAVKYPDTFSSNGWDYGQARDLSKSMYSHMGGDRAFFEWHSENIPLEEEDNEPSETTIYDAQRIDHAREGTPKYTDPDS